MQIRFLTALGHLTRKGIIGDMLAGVSVAAVNIPQVLGYARIAGAPVVTGLYTLVLPLIAFALFGSSRHLIVAADSATAAIFAGSLSTMATPGGEQYMALVGMVAMLTAGLLLMARIFRLGFLADFLSRTVLVGFLTGVGLQVCIAMLSDMTGVRVTSRYTLGRAWEVMQGLAQPNVPTLCLAVTVAVAVLLGNRFARRLPIALLAVLATIAASNAFDFAHRDIALIGPVPSGLPLLKLPQVTWSEILALFPISASCFVMIIAQSAATSRGFALRYRESVDPDADILGLAAANAAASLSGALVVNGSPTQTAMAERMGARSQVAQLMLAGVVITVLIFFTGPLQYLPRCVLAAIVFTIAIGMIDVSRLRAIRRESPGEFALAVITAATVVALGVEQGILLAIALSLFRHVRHSYRPHTMILAPADNGTWVPAPAVPGRTTTADLIVYRFGADLFYANANRFADEVRALIQCSPTPICWFIVDCAAITDLDYSAALAIRDLLDELERRHIVVVFGRVNPYLRSDMDRHCISPVVGNGRIFSTLHEAIALAHGGEPNVAVGA
jgi:sulfate permease, SulP family